MRQLEVFFDYECPYCKKGYEDLMELLPRYEDIEVIWRPCEAHPRPEEHPPHTDLVIQGYYLAKAEGADIHRYHERMFDAVHTDRIDVEDPEVLADYIEGIVHPKVFLEAIESGKYRDVQEEGNTYAYEENDVWYLPAFRMEGRKLDSQGGVGVSKGQIEAFLDGR